MTIASKLPDAGSSIFSVMSALGDEHGAVNLFQGFPDFDTPPTLIDRVLARMRAGRNQYTPMQGVAVLLCQKRPHPGTSRGDIMQDLKIALTEPAPLQPLRAIEMNFRPGWMPMARWW